MIPSLDGTVAFTGRLASMRRADAFEIVRKKGGKPRRGVTKTPDILIVGQLGWPLLDDGRPSNSLKRAKTYDVPIASEPEFLPTERRSRSANLPMVRITADCLTVWRMPVTTPKPNSQGTRC